MATGQAEQRKLAAILVADVVGYSRLAGADEDRVLARLRTLRSDLIDPTISVHHGRVVKRGGDAHLKSRRGALPQLLLGKVARRAGWGVGRRFDLSRIARTSARTRGPSARLTAPHPTGFAGHLPRFAEKGRLAAACKLDDCESCSRLRGWGWRRIGRRGADEKMRSERSQ